MDPAPLRRPADAGDGSTQAFSAGVAVAGVTALAVLGPLVGLSPGWITLGVGLALGGLTLDAARFGGRGGHLLAEALPGGQARLRRIAIHEAGHVLLAREHDLPVNQVLVGSLACLRAGLAASGSTALEAPGQARLPLEDLRRWSAVLQAGMVAEDLVYGSSRGGADDRALLGQLWGLSGQDVATAQREQRRARREVEQCLNRQRQALEALAHDLINQAPTLLRLRPQSVASSGGPLP